MRITFDRDSLLAALTQGLSAVADVAEKSAAPSMRTTAGTFEYRGMESMFTMTARKWRTAYNRLRFMPWGWSACGGGVI